MHRQLEFISRYLLLPNEIFIDSYYEDALNQNYNAATFKLRGSICVFRVAKLTPNKLGNFVALWKRPVESNIHLGVTVPYAVSDFDFCLIAVEKENFSGVFIFPNSILKIKGIVSSSNDLGKRGFRLYPKWDTLTSKQAIKSQNWQLDYFIDFTDVNKINLEKFQKIITQII